MLTSKQCKKCGADIEVMPASFPYIPVNLRCNKCDVWLDERSPDPKKLWIVAAAYEFGRSIRSKKL